MLLIYGLSSAFTIFMAVHAVRHGKAGSWLWIILFFGPIGSAIYFFSEVLDTSMAFGRGGPRKATAREAQRAEAEARRLDTAGAWTHCSSLFRQRSEFTRAVAAARRALERSPKDLEARYELGMALFGDGHPAEAAEVLDELLGRDGSYAGGDALWAAARAHAEAGNDAAARLRLERLTETSSRPEVLFELASVQARLGDHEAARTNLGRIIDEAQLVPDYLQRSVKPWVRKAEKGLKRLDASP